MKNQKRENRKLKWNKKDNIPPSKILALKNTMSICCQPNEMSAGSQSITQKFVQI